MPNNYLLKVEVQQKGKMVGRVCIESLAGRREENSPYLRSMWL